MKTSRTTSIDLSGATPVAVEKITHISALPAVVDQCRVISDNKDFQGFVSLLDRPASRNAGLNDLFSRPAPWKKVLN